METLESFVDHLASPPWLFSLALILFLAARGTKRPWTPSGGWLLLALSATFLGMGLSHETFRRLPFHPDRLPAAVLLLSTAVLLWFEMARSRRGGPADDLEDATASRGISPADVVAASVVGLAVVVCAWLYPAAAGPLADPASKPDLVRAPWFLLGLREISHYFDPWVSYRALPLLFVVGLLALPRLATGGATARLGRSLFLFSWLLLWLWPLAVAVFLRGPHWIAFGPFEAWDPSRPDPAEPLAFSKIFWTRWLGGIQPDDWRLRELPGILALTSYFVLLPVALQRLGAIRGALASYRESLGAWRFHALVTATLALLIVPLKMYGRWWLNLGHWIHIPELPFTL